MTKAYDSPRVIVVVQDGVIQSVHSDTDNIRERLNPRMRPSNLGKGVDAASYKEKGEEDMAQSQKGFSAVLTRDMNPRFRHRPTATWTWGLLTRLKDL